MSTPNFAELMMNRFVAESDPNAQLNAQAAATFIEGHRKQTEVAVSNAIVSVGNMLTEAQANDADPAVITALKAQLAKLSA